MSLNPSRISTSLDLPSLQPPLKGQGGSVMIEAICRTSTKATIRQSMLRTLS